MALSRVTTWSSGQVLTASALNGEFDNIINNVATLFNPLTANLDLGGFSLLNLAVGSVSTPGLYFNGDSNTGLYRAAADTAAIAAGGVDAMRFGTTASAVNYLQATPGATGTGATLASAGSDTNVDLVLDPQGSGNVTVAGNAALVPAAHSGTPAQHGLFRANVIKGWVKFNGTGTIAVDASYNVSSITDNGTGDYTVTWDRDFASGEDYAIAGFAQGSSTGSGLVAGTNSAADVLAAGSVRFWTVTGAAHNLEDAREVCLIAVGNQ